MKAIHNGAVARVLLFITVFNTSNIQNESNSQQENIHALQHNNCVQYVKYTK